MADSMELCGASNPHQLLSETRAAMEEVAAKILSLKKDPSRSNSDLRDLLTNVSILFISLRQANRSILLEEDRAKAETEKARAPVDFTTLQLHNLMYEKNYYLKAIKACKDFRSKYPDIELVPEVEFLTDAPEEIKGSVKSKDDGHNLMLKRLDYELYQRKELCRHREKLEQHKKHLLETIATRKKFLSSLPSHLKSLKKASLPVQQQLGMQHTKKSKQHHAAELLPPSLYIVYTQLLSQKEAFGEKVELEVVGSMKDAQAFFIQQSNKDKGLPNTETTRMEDETPDDEDDGQRRRKRPRKPTGKDSLENLGQYESHPLNVVVHVYDDEESEASPSKLLTLRFEYLVKLNVVCVGIEGAEGPENSILCNLFPDDPGLQLPHQMAKLYAGDSMAFDDKRLSRPYKWAQHLAGMDFLPEISPLLADGSSNNEMVKSTAILSGLSLYRCQNRVETLLQRVRSRRKAQLALLEQLDSLAKCEWPSVVYKNVPWASQIPVCVLERWSFVEPDPTFTLAVPSIAVEQSLETLDLNMEDRLGILKDGVESATEDGELPSAVQVSAAPDELDPVTPFKGSLFLEHSRSFSLIAKSSASSMGKSPRSVKHDENLELLWDTESDTDQYMEPERDNDILPNEPSVLPWEKHGVRKYEFMLSRADKDKTLKLLAEVSISIEYPLRPPLFSLYFSDSISKSAGDSDINGGLRWYNELRAMEAEVNLHILKILPREHEIYILAHQMHCLAMLFDFHFDQLQKWSDTIKSNSLVDLGLCKPVTGNMIARYFRGRDRRRMFSWKDTECAPGYPY